MGKVKNDTCQRDDNELGKMKEKVNPVCGCCRRRTRAIDGLMLQCGRCRKAYYCTMECFNQDMDNHVQFCRTNTEPEPANFDSNSTSLSVQEGLPMDLLDINSCQQDCDTDSDLESDDWETDSEYSYYSNEENEVSHLTGNPNKVMNEDCSNGDAFGVDASEDETSSSSDDEAATVVSCSQVAQFDWADHGALNTSLPSIDEILEDDDSTPQEASNGDEAKDDSDIVASKLMAVPLVNRLRRREGISPKKPRNSEIVQSLGCGGGTLTSEKDNYSLESDISNSLGVQSVDDPCDEQKRMRSRLGNLSTLPDAGNTNSGQRTVLKSLSMKREKFRMHSRLDNLWSLPARDSNQNAPCSGSKDLAQPQRFQNIGLGLADRDNLPMEWEPITWEKPDWTKDPK
jgi:hypothetical protein